MARRRRVIKKRETLDGRFGSQVVSRLINTVMISGKKSLAERIVYAAIEETRQGADSVDPLDILTRALENIKPKLEVKSRRVGGATYQVPMEVPPARQAALAMRWLIALARAKKSVPMHRALAQELKDAAAGQGNAIKKRDEMHKMAQANRAFAHFRY
jgi:small subunit ribosomal protein S7